MDGRQFEHYLGYVVKSQGYVVKVTRAAGDYKADLMIEKDGRNDDKGGAVCVNRH